MLRFKKTRICLFLSFILFLNSCSNVFDATANKKTDEAIYEDAVKANNTGDFDTAITKIKSMSTGKQAETVTKQLLASAYMGKCGYNFISYFTVITAGNGSVPVMKWLMNNWTNSTTDRTYCKLAETTMKTITPTYVGRSKDDSLFMVFLGFAKAGIYMREILDSDRNGAVSNPPFDGSLGGSFCDCSNISTANMAEIAVGIGTALANTANTSINLSSVDLSAIDSSYYIEDTSLYVAGSTTDIVYRGLLNSSDYGLVSTNNYCVAVVACP